MFIRSLLLGASFAVVGSVAAQAADLIIPTTPMPIYEEAGFSWDGMYAGIRAGGIFNDGDDTDGVIGGVVGVNFMAVDAFVVGAEVSGDYVWTDGEEDYGQFLASLRAGAVVTDAALIYAIGGVGVNVADGDSDAIYQLGGGVEFLVTENVSVRGEVVGLGTFDDGDDFFEGTKATVGVSYHF
ncbi:outer membrane protein [Devosia sp. RR2S18]|uniref:outer membrane protein n=1 Tax=Devosia rhizosphaerae TaxID=3049774 RepID=UPI00253FFB1F|nr:outer membrane beta-barrel protein [Devosia sp. RR2S18]WIJ24476.1 outer membrane beta-barrel protein [Devosia sp. RR2S18]